VPRSDGGNGIALGGRQLDVQTTYGIVELFQVPRTHDGTGHAWLGQNPGEGQLRGRGSALTGGLHETFDDVEGIAGEVAFIVVSEGLEASAAGHGLPTSVLTSEHSSGQRIVGDDPQALGLAQRQDLALDGPVQRVVHWLDADKACPMAPLRGPQELAQLPGSQVRAAQIAHLALAHHVVQRPHRFFHGHAGIPSVNLVEINDLDLQALEARLHCALDVYAREPTVVGTWPGYPVDLGGQHDALACAPLFQPAADHLLGHAGRIDVRCVKKAAPHFHVAIHDLEGRFHVGLSAKGHRAQANARHFQARPTQSDILHRVPPFAV